jgi:predicted nuclease with TOPRIM domain
MNVKDYCNGVEIELTAWKAKLYDLTRKVDKLGSKEREKVLQNIEDLHILVTEMGDRIEQLKNECPTEWSPQKKDIDGSIVDMRGKYEETMEFIGKYAPVSIPG